MDVRKFYLQNGNGDRIGLNGENNIFYSDPSGLGVTLAPIFGDLNRGFFAVLSEDSEPQQALGGNLNFTRKETAYAQYYELMRWLSAAGEGLTLVYLPYGETEFFRRVSLSRTVKSEKGRTGWLTCAIEVKARTPWYTPTALEVPLVPHDESEAVYDAAYYDEGTYPPESPDTYAATIAPAGDTPAGILFSFKGAVTNPVLTLTGAESGKEYGRCAVNASFAARDTLQYSSAYTGAYCRRISGQTVTDLDDYIDPASEAFFRLPVDEACALQLTGQGISGSARAEIYYYYRTV